MQGRGHILQFGQAHSDTDVSAEIVAIWSPIGFIHGSIDSKIFFLTESYGCTAHPSLSIDPDLIVCCQLGSLMLSDAFYKQVTHVNQYHLPPSIKKKLLLWIDHWMKAAGAQIAGIPAKTFMSEQTWSNCSLFLTYQMLNILEEALILAWGWKTME